MSAEENTSALNDSMPPKTDFEQICVNIRYTHDIIASMKCETAEQENVVADAQAELSKWENGVVHRLRKVFEE